MNQHEYFNLLLNYRERNKILLQSVCRNYNLCILSKEDSPMESRLTWDDGIVSLLA